MEVYDEDYVKIGKWIRDIYRRLTTGIAIIAIQKKSNTAKQDFDYSRGGETTLEKPRLYLAMDKGIIKIVKAKWFRTHGVSPNGKIRRWKLIDGWKFLPSTAWIDPAEEKTTQTKKKYTDYGVGGVDKDEDGTFTHED
jgi:hypothetical protein